MNEPDRSVTPRRASALFGAAFAFVFLMTFDAEEPPPGMLALSRWVVLMPAAFLLALRPAARPWNSGLALTVGVFAGVCLAAIAYASNLWPIAGVICTAIWLPPIVIGSVAGVLVSHALEWARR